MVGPRAIAAILLVPGALAWNGAAWLEASARGLGAELGHRLPPLAPLPLVATAPLPLLVVDDGAAAPADAAEDSDGTGVAEAASKGTAPKKGRKKPASKQPAGPSVYVSEQDVLRLARARAVPGSAPVPANGERPGGVQLYGVSALGVGMQDGDVITEVAGRQIQSEGDVVGVVIAARARHARSLSAVFYRGKSRGTLVVAMPYLE